MSGKNGSFPKWLRALGASAEVHGINPTSLAGLSMRPLSGVKRP
jgi:hypothetical protein